MSSETQSSGICALTAVLLSALLVGTASDAGAWATITVDSLADPGAPGICVLRDAITAANTMTATNGCAAGNGHDTIQFSVTGTILLASTLPEVTDSNLTINGPASPGITIDGGNAVQVMQVASGATLNLDNLTITDGLAEFNGGAGGIVNQGTLSVTHSTFSGNDGGNIIFGGTGAIVNQGTLIVINSTFSDNFPGDGVVGGIFNQGALTITSSTFSRNRHQFINEDGTGAIDNRGTLTVTKSTFSGNSTNDDSGDAGILNRGTLTVTNSTFSSNSGGGTGAIDNHGTAIVIGSTFSGNGAGTNGGAGAAGIANGNPFSSSPATATVVNSTFSNNFSGTIDAASGILNGVGSTLTVTNSTLEINSDIHNFGVAALKGTIVTGNPPGGETGGGNCAPLFGSTLPVTDEGYNISDDDSCGFTATGSLNNTDPKLDPGGLANNGGPTQTIALASESPAIDAIPVSSCTDQDGNLLTTDQRGFPRPDAGEDVCDIGAYEFQDNTTPSAVTVTIPATGATVSGKVSIVADVSAAVSWTDVYIDGVYLTSSPPYSFTWNSASVPDGSHTVSATAFDGSGTAIGTSSITVSVDNITPTSGVTITAPNGDATVSGNVIIATQVSTEVSWIDVYIDGIYLTSSPPYSFNWNSSSVPNGSHTVSAIAFDSSGTAIGAYGLITVNVKN